MSKAAQTAKTLNDAQLQLLRINHVGFLAPLMQQRARAFTEMMTGRGHDPLIFETLRLPALQVVYHARGVSKQSDVLRSMHGHGCAFDCISVSRGWNYTPRWKADALECAKACDLKCGGEWKSPVDWPHFQLIEFPGIVPDTFVRAFNADGLHGVWAVAGMLPAVTLPTVITRA